MKFARFSTIVGACFFVGLISATVWPCSAYAADSSAKTPEERHHERGNILREQSKYRAQSHLGYENVVSDLYYNRNIDFFSLGEQIKRLGALLQQVPPPAQAARAQPLIPSMPHGSGPMDVKAVYGPEGPTEKSVRLILEYRLVVTGNPRLKVGSVKDTGKSVSARIVTKDGSVVEEYSVDKKTGVWAPVRE